MGNLTANIYNLFVKTLVDGNLDVKSDFENYIQTRRSGGTIDSGLYALKLNFKYRVLKYSQDKADAKLCYPETRKIEQQQVSADGILKAVSEADIVSFDVFDTLIFRPFSNPYDLFHLLEIDNGICGFRSLRVRAEQQANSECKAAGREAEIRDIYEILNKWCGIDIQSGIQAEYEMEKNLCFANPLMLQVVRELAAKNKKMICVSDMYLSDEMIAGLLESCGYPAFEKIYVSCDQAACKYEGTLQQKVLEAEGKDNKICHIGDNFSSDVMKSREYFWRAEHYTNINRINQEYRPAGMHYITGSIYKGIVSSHFYSQPKMLDTGYEYGFTCGGLLLWGFSQWLYSRVKELNIDKVLFMARDGKVVYDLFDKYYPEISKEYVYFSRSASERIVADEYFEEFIINCVQPLFMKKGTGKTVKELLEHCGLDFLQDKTKLSLDASIDSIGYEGIRTELYRLKQEITVGLASSKKAGLDYIKAVVGDAKSVFVVDSGWRGSSIAYMKKIVGSFSDCKVYGGLVIASPSEYSDAYRACGIIDSYINVETNRKLVEICKSQDKRVVFECLFSSTDSTLLRYEEDAKEGYRLVFGRNNPEKEIVERIQSGMWDFIDAYNNRLGSYARSLVISPEDAIAPYEKVSLSADFVNKIVSNCNNNALARHGQSE